MQRLAALMPRPRLHLIRLHGVLAPNAKLRALVVPQELPQEPEPAARQAKPAVCEANCAHHHPVRLGWAKLLQTGVRDRRGALPEPRRLAEDHRGDPAAAGDREDPHPSWAAGPATAAGASPWVATASDLTSPAFHCSCGLPPRAARINSARNFREGSIRPKNPQESGSPGGDHNDGRVWAALSTLSSAEADSKDHSKHGQLPCRGGKGREKGRLTFLSSGQVSRTGR